MADLEIAGSLPVRQDRLGLGAGVRLSRNEFLKEVALAHDVEGRCSSVKGGQPWRGRKAADLRSDFAGL